MSSLPWRRRQGVRYSASSRSWGGRGGPRSGPSPVRRRRGRSRSGSSRSPASGAPPPRRPRRGGPVQLQGRGDVEAGRDLLRMERRVPEGRAAAHGGAHQDQPPGAPGAQEVVDAGDVLQVARQRQAREVAAGLAVALEVEGAEAEAGRPAPAGGRNPPSRPTARSRSHGDRGCMDARGLPCGGGSKRTARCETSRPFSTMGIFSMPRSSRPRTVTPAVRPRQGHILRASQTSGWARAPGGEDGWET